MLDFSKNYLSKNWVENPVLKDGFNSLVDFTEPVRMETIILEDLNVSGLVKNRKLARAISQQGWYEFRTLCERQSEKFGREFRVISRWEPTSQSCSNCGFRWGKLDLKIRSVQCLNCGIEHDRDENAAKNINKVGIGHCHDSKWTQQ